MAVKRSYDWILPFKQLRENLVKLYETRRIFHVVNHFMADDNWVEEHLDDFLMQMPAACDGRFEISVIRSPLEHIQEDRLYADNYDLGVNTYELLRHYTRGMSEWVSQSPEHIFPNVNSVTMREAESEGTKDYLLWVSIVYYLAWKTSLPYFRVRTFGILLGENRFEWGSNPRHLKFDPCRILTHFGDSNSERNKWDKAIWEKEDFIDVPNVFFAELTSHDKLAEFIGASITAIDVLFHIWVPLQMSLHEEARQPERMTDRTSKPGSKIEREVEALKGRLVLESKKPDPKPLTWDKIAVMMGWYNKKRVPDQSKTQRRMEKIFGKKPMEKYVRTFSTDLSSDSHEDKESDS